MTGRARFGADFDLPGQLDRPRAAQPAPARAHRLDRHLEGRGAARREGGRHPRRLRGPAVRVHPGRRDDDELQGRGAQRDGAREGALRGPCGRRRRRDQRGDRPAGAEADRGRVRGAAARDRRGRGDAARTRRCCTTTCSRPASSPSPTSRPTSPSASSSTLGDVEAGFKKADVIVEREFKTAAGAPGLHRAARVRWPASPRTAQAELWCTHAGPLHRARPLRAAARHATSRKIRVTATEIGGGFGGKTVVYLEPLAHRALAEGQAAGEDGDVARGGVQGHRPDLGRHRAGQDRRHEGRHASSPADARAQVPGRRLPGLAGAARRACAPSRRYDMRERPGRSATTWCRTGRRWRPTARPARRSRSSPSRAWSTRSPRSSASTRSSCA